MPIARDGNALETKVLGEVGRFKCASNSPLCAEAERIPFRYVSISCLGGGLRGFPSAFSIQFIHFSFRISTDFHLTLRGLARYFNYRKVRHVASASAQNFHKTFRGDSCRLICVIS
jgi:hypothetical protein